MTLDVFGLQIKVKFVKNPKLDCGKVVKGYYDYENKEIAIESTLKGIERNQALLHELGHAVADRLHLDAETSLKVLHPIIDTFATCVSENFHIKKR